MTRLNKYIANAGVCNRREADQLILSGKIMVNGNVITVLGTKVSKEDIVEYNGKALSCKKFQYLLINKPVGQEAINLGQEYINDITVKPVVSMNTSSAGLLIYSNDIELINRIATNKKAYRQKCILELDKEADLNLIEKLEIGFNINHAFFKAYKAQFGNKGNNKRMIVLTSWFFTDDTVVDGFEFLGYKILHIDRVEIFGIKKGPLKRGKSRVLNNKEIGFLKMVKGLA